MLNPVKAVVKFNQDAGLLEAGYDDFRESSFQIEEALEGFPTKEVTGLSPKELARQIVRDMSEMPPDYDLAFMMESSSMSPDEAAEHVENNRDTIDFTISDVDRLDKAVDAFIFSVGAMAKLGLSPQQITEAVLIVNNANQQKLKNPKIDEYGKLGKAINFISPEEKLQALLNKRSINE